MLKQILSSWTAQELQIDEFYGTQSSQEICLAVITLLGLEEFPLKWKCKYPKACVNREIDEAKLQIFLMVEQIGNDRKGLNPTIWAPYRKGNIQVKNGQGKFEALNNTEKRKFPKNTKKLVVSHPSCLIRKFP